MVQPQQQAMTTTPATITIGVLALQGAFVEHISLLRQAAGDLHIQVSDRPSGGDHYASHEERIDSLSSSSSSADVTCPDSDYTLTLIEVRTPAELARCDGLIIPGGESTSISLIAERTGLLEPLREFVKVQRRPTWGTCAGLILLAESANKSKASGQELIGGLDVRVQRNYFGRQVESFEAELSLPFLEDGGLFRTVFIRAPVVERVLPSASTSMGEVPLAAPDDTVVAPAKQATKARVEILGRLPGRAKAIKDRTTTAEDLGEEGDIVAVRQGNVFGTAFHPELTGDGRIHGWWLREVMKAVRERGKA
ncbi:hypothetical protein LTR85_002340 [Meristemomyces frigidus]|nr:hypothetical protein LTR85_002340 [Meristemomyces frigidus]